MKIAKLLILITLTLTFISCGDLLGPSPAASDFTINISDLSWVHLDNLEKYKVSEYKEIDDLCYYPDYGVLYGFIGSSVVRIAPETENQPTDAYETFQACKPYFTDDISLIEVETEFGTIEDYHSFEDFGVEFASTDLGKVIYRKDKQSWLDITPDIPEFQATSIAVDHTNLILYASTKSNGIFKLTLSNDG